MNQYIIDGYTLDEIERLLNMPEHAWDDSDYGAKETALKLIHSHPYNPQAEREKVLDELLGKLTDEITGNTETSVGLYLATRIVRKLREGKEGMSFDIPDMDSARKMRQRRKEGD